jgi:hypothetical protein
LFLARRSETLRRTGRFALGFAGALIVNISSIVHGVKGAKKVNRARGFSLGENIYLNIQPIIIPQNNLLTGEKYGYGMNVCLSF